MQREREREEKVTERQPCMHVYSRLLIITIDEHYNVIVFVVISLI